MNTDIRIRKIYGNHSRYERFNAILDKNSIFRRTLPRFEVEFVSVAQVNIVNAEIAPASRHQILFSKKPAQITRLLQKTISLSCENPPAARNLRRHTPPGKKREPAWGEREFLKRAEERKKRGKPIFFQNARPERRKRDASAAFLINAVFSTRALRRTLKGNSARVNAEAILLISPNKGSHAFRGGEGCPRGV